MRTHFDIDDALMARAMSAGPCKTWRGAVQAGLELIARQAACAEVVPQESAVDPSRARR